MNLSVDHDQSISGAKWDSLKSGWISHSSVILSHVVQVAQNALVNTKETGQYLFNHLQNKVRTVPLTPIIKKINTVCTDVEKIFNIGSSTPWIGFLSGTLRAVLGQVQAVVGIALTTISQVGLIIASLSKAETALVAKWQNISKLGIELTIHGCLNFIRGIGEALIGKYTFGLGNIVLIAPNTMFDRGFTPYFAYGSITNDIPKDTDEFPIDANEISQYTEIIKIDADEIHKAIEPESTYFTASAK